MFEVRYMRRDDGVLVNFDASRRALVADIPNYYHEAPVILHLDATEG